MTLSSTNLANLATLNQGTTIGAFKPTLKTSDSKYLKSRATRGQPVNDMDHRGGMAVRVMEEA